MPGPQLLRLSIFATLMLFAVIGVSYNFGRLHASTRGPAVDSERSAGQAWGRQSLIGTRFVKVPALSGNLSLCELRDGGELTERWLPLHPDLSRADPRMWSGVWSVDRATLRVVVGGYHLTLEPDDRGLWSGIEQYADDFQHFIGGVVEPRLIRTGERWTGLKLGERGVHRVIAAEPAGRLVEWNPFHRAFEGDGEWRVDGTTLCVTVGKWSLVARPWIPGVLLGLETSDEPDQGFAVVRIRNSPPRAR